MELSRWPAPGHAARPCLGLTLAFATAFVTGCAPADEPGAAELGFRPAVNAAPPGFSPTFALSHNYPATMPPCSDTSRYPWLDVNVDFEAEVAEWSEAWSDYLSAIFEYVRYGQDPNLQNDVGIRTEVEGEDRWFHVPWMAYDERNGREFVHGLTNELAVRLSYVLGAGRGSGLHHLPIAGRGTGPLFETWAVGVYNDCGGFTLGQAFHQSGVPATTVVDGQPRIQGMPFPEGTLVFKLLYTTATPDQVPYLEGTSRWQANRHAPIDDTTFACHREIQDVHLVQMDVAVVDERSPTRWVYGTYTYNGNLPGETVWERLDPLGVQFGNDPLTFPAVPMEVSRPARETITRAPFGGIYEHQGCSGRLAGPVDEAESSCLSCHNASYTANVGDTTSAGNQYPNPLEFESICYTNDAVNQAYFSNYRYPDGYPVGDYPGQINLDTSLQLQVAFASYGQWNTLGEPQPAPTTGSCHVR